MEKTTRQVTALLCDWRNGSQTASDELMPLIYQELHRLAAHYLRGERFEHTLQPTALVNELYLKLFAAEPITWQNRAHFFGVAARGMRNILVDYARAHKAEKRGGKQIKVSLTAAAGSANDRDEYVLELENALKRLEQLDPRVAKVVELRFFGGLQEDHIAEVLGVSVKTICRDWRFARTWLQSQLLDSTEAV